MAKNTREERSKVSGEYRIHYSVDRRVKVGGTRVRVWFSLTHRWSPQNRFSTKIAKDLLAHVRVTGTEGGLGTLLHTHTHTQMSTTCILKCKNLNSYAQAST